MIFDVSPRRRTDTLMSHSSGGSQSRSPKSEHDDKYSNVSYTPLMRRETHAIEYCGRFQFNIARSQNARMRHENRFSARPITMESRGEVSLWTKFRWGKWVIRPIPSKNMPHWIIIWDFYVTVLVLATSIYVPLQAALSIESMRFDYLCDCSFVMDMVMQFFVAQPASGKTINNHGLWITDPIELASRYLKGAFWVDMVSISPVFVQNTIHYRYVAARASSQYKRYAAAAAEDEAQHSVRVMHICRIVRLTRIARIVNKWQTTFGISFFTIRFLKFCCIIAFSTHWFACAWALLVNQETLESIQALNPSGRNWLTALIDAKGDPCTRPATEDPACVYFLSVYWSAATLTTVGYGDVTPQNLFEYLASAGMMIMSGIVWAYVVGSIVSMMSNSNPEKMEYNQRVDNLNLLMDDHDISWDLRVRLRRYMLESRHVTRMRGHRKLLRDFISPGLQREIAEASAHAPLLGAVWWIADLADDPYHEFVRCLISQFYGPIEPLTAVDEMLVVGSGLIAARGLILSRGDVWGHETVLIESFCLGDERSAMTLTYVDVFSLHREDIADVMSNYPEVALRIRKAQVKVAALRGFIWAAGLEKEGLDWHHFSNCLASRGEIHLADRVHHPEITALRTFKYHKSHIDHDVQWSKVGRLSETQKWYEEKQGDPDASKEASPIEELTEVVQLMRNEFQEQLRCMEAQMATKEDLAGALGAGQKRSNSRQRS